LGASALFYIKRYIKHWFSAKRKGGFGVHSPFVFHFITKVIEEKNPYYSYSEVERVRKSLLSNTETINVIDYGTGPSCKKRVCDIAKSSLKSSKLAQLIFRIAISNKSKSILELGTSLGVTTLYLSKTDSRASITTLEGSPETASVAQRYIKNADANNVQIVVGDIDSTLPKVLNEIKRLDLVFFDANHREEPTLNYFRQCLKKIDNSTIFIFDDINHSPEMVKAWEQIKKEESVRVTIDIFYMGIVFFNKNLQKEDYKIGF